MNNKVVTVDPQVISAKYRKRITIAAETTRYYAQVFRDITPTNIYWKALPNFDFQWNALKDLKKKDDIEAPNLTKNGSIIKWIEYFKFHLNAIVGVCNCPLVYVVRDQHDLSGVTSGTLLIDQPQS